MNTLNLGLMIFDGLCVLVWLAAMALEDRPGYRPAMSLMLLAPLLAIAGLRLDAQQQPGAHALMAISVLVVGMGLYGLRRLKQRDERLAAARV